MWSKSYLQFTEKEAEAEGIKRRQTRSCCYHVGVGSPTPRWEAPSISSTFQTWSPERIFPFWKPAKEHDFKECNDEEKATWSLHKAFIPPCARCSPELTKSLKLGAGSRVVTTRLQKDSQSKTKLSPTCCTPQNKSIWKKPNQTKKNPNRNKKNPNEKQNPETQSHNKMENLDLD